MNPTKNFEKDREDSTINTVIYLQNENNIKTNSTVTRKTSNKTNSNKKNKN